MTRVPMKKIVDFGTEYLKKCGVPEDRARYLSECIVDAEAFRLSTHGLVQFAQIEANLGKTIDPSLEPKVVLDRGATAVIDGKDCIGNLSVKLAKELAVKKARDFGVGFVSARNTNWIGGLGIHLYSLAEQGFLAQLFAQSAACKDCAPFGGFDPRFSTNPIALAFPTGGEPVIADFSTATMSLGSAMSLIQKGAKADAKRFLDSKGEPTDDPKVLKEGGTLMFMGGDVDGHKGYALSLWIESLVALSGASANNPELPNLQSFMLMVLDPEAFAGKDYYLKEMKRFVAHVKSSRARPGFQSIMLPGEAGLGRLAECRQKGIPLDQSKMEILNTLAVSKGLEAPA